MVGIGIGIGIGIGGNQGGTPSKGPLCDAIERKLCVTAMHDDQLLKLAPHVVYERGRRTIPTVDAILLARDDRPVNRPALRTYAVDDLSNITITNDGFTVFPGFEPDDTEYAGRTICVVQMVQIADDSA